MQQYKYLYTKRTAAKIKVVDACHAQNMHE